MQQSVLRSHFDVTGTAPVRHSIPSGSVAFRQAILLAIALLGAGWQSSFAVDIEDGLLDFTAKWCGPCQQMSSIVSKLERQGAPIRKVDIDQERDLAQRFRIESIPCFVLVSNGKEVERVTGLQSEKTLISMLNRLPKQAPRGRSSQVASNDDVSGGPRLGMPVPIPIPKTSDRTKGSNSNSQFDFVGNSKTRNATDNSDPTKFLGQSPDETTDPLQAAVRIRVKDGGEINFGSGTVIESRPGRAVIVTCSHIFRNLSNDAVIEVDVYPATGGAKPETVIGKLLDTDPDADVGVMAITCSRRLPSIRLALLDKPLVKQDRLVSIGCSGGDKPTREEHQLTGINRYDGPENLECTGQPQQGRSGGGLFRGSELVGVCIAADTKQKRGIYAGLKPIGVLLDKVGLGSLYPRLPSSAPANRSNQFADASDRDSRLDVDLGSSGPGRSQSGIDDLNRMLQAELNGAGAGTSDLAGAEVVCIVRSKTPGGPSRVIIVNQASERFVDDLLHESRGVPSVNMSALTPTGPVETSFEPKAFRRAGSK